MHDECVSITLFFSPLKPPKKVNQFLPHFKWWTFGISLKKKLQNKTMEQIKDTRPGISAVIKMKWRHKVCVAGGWWGGGADQIWLERQCHSCPLHIGLWELGQGSRVERQTQTAAVEDVKSLARVDRELGVVTQRPVSTPPYRPSDRPRRENFPCCIPVLLSGLSGNACNSAGGGLQLPACTAHIYLPQGYPLLKDSKASENVMSREPGSRVDLRLLHGPSDSLSLKHK